MNKLTKGILSTFLSRKFLATATCVWLVIWFDAKYNERFERTAPEKAAHLITMMVTTSGTLAAILVGYLGFQTLQTRFGLSGVAQVMASRNDGITEHTEKREDIQRIIHESAEKFAGDESYRPIQPDTTEEFR